MVIIAARPSFVQSVDDMEVFKLAYAVLLSVHKASLSFPKIEQYDLGSQMRRASKCVCANLAEGFAKQSDSKAEFRRFISLALGSCGEMRVWCRYCADLGYVDTQITFQWREQYLSVIKMLQKLKNNTL